MAVAITCGYGGYLLPLLAAHSSWILGNKFLWNIIQNTNIFCQENIVYKITAIFYDLNLLKQYQKIIVLASQATNSAWGVWLVL